MGAVWRACGARQGRFGVAVPAGDEPENVGLASGEVGEQWVRRRRGRLFAGLSADVRDDGGDGNFTRCDSADVLDQPFW
jgi:hypothetical protein